MLTFPSALKIYLAVEPVDMRKAFNGLWTVAEQKLREDPRNGAVFVFVNKDRDRLKMLYWDGTGVVENAIRPTKLGAKNWLFIGHPDAGQRSAIIYSIVGSCRRQGIDPLLYLREVLTRLPSMTTRSDVRSLLPSRW
ncbi:MAG: IS66 family insertion sequence element accessory protein TnpB [Opitutaceae bacterium]|nr:IS66 family insertion sequence element accessory protein TnpB [Opitutaceae bacterium]